MSRVMAHSSGHQKYSCSCGLTQQSTRLSGKCKQCHGSLKPKKGKTEIVDYSIPRPPCNSGPIIIDERPNLTQPAAGSYGGEPSPSERRISTERRRSRSADRGDGRQSISEPPPYYTLVDFNRRRNVGLRRTESEEPTYRTENRRTRATPPPPYMDADASNPPSYEEALASSMSRLSTNSGLSALIATTPAFRERSTFSSGFFDTPLTRPEVQRYANRETVRNPRRLTQRQAEREARRQRDQELEEEMERQRTRELQVAEYCGCAKCQSLFYNYYYDDAVSSAPPIPMETQVIMQQFFGDGLTFCSIM